MAVTKAGRVAELLGRRTLHGKVFGLDDGSLQVELYGRPIHYRDADNLWQDIDLTAVDDLSVPEFDAVYRKCHTPVRFSRSPKRPWQLRFSQDQWIIYRACDGRNSRAVVSGPTVLYADAWDGADLRYTVLGHGVKEEIILKGPLAPASYAFDVETYGVNLQSDGRGGYGIIGSGGGIVALLPPPSAVDAIGAMGPVTLVWDVDTKRLTIVVDPLWLANPARIWPVTLDPTTIQPDAAGGKDTYIAQWAGTNNYGTTDPIRVGCEVTGATYNDRSLLEFATALLEPYDDYNATVATADLRCSAEVNATDRTVDLCEVLAVWGEMTATWNNQPAHAVVTHSEIITGIDTWFLWDVLVLVQKWLYTPSTNMGMMFISQSEGITSSRKDFYSSDSGSSSLRPRLVLTLNARPTATPTAPLGTLGAPGAVTDDVSPTFTWTYADAEANPQVGLQARIYTDAGALVYDSGDVASAVASHTAPADTLDYGVLYKWQVRVRDASGWSFWSGLQWFKCVMSVPTGLVATPDAGDNHIDLAWDAHPGEDLVGYHIYREHIADMGVVAESVNYGGTIRALTALGGFVYCAGETTRKVWKLDPADMSIVVAESADYGGSIHALTALDGFIYCGGVTTKKVWKLNASDLVKVGESADYGGSIYALTALDGFVYCAGPTTKKVWKLDPADMSKVAESADYGSTIFALAALDGFVYCGGDVYTTCKVWKLNASDLVKVGESVNYGGYINALTVLGNYVYCGGYATRKVWKLNASDLVKVAESVNYGGTIRALTVLGGFVYCAGETTRKVWRLNASDLVKVGESADYGGTVWDLTVLGNYVYCGGETTKKVWRINPADSIFALLTSTTIAANSYIDGACGSGVLYSYKVAATSADGYISPQSVATIENVVTFATWRLSDIAIRVRAISLSWPVLSDKIQLPGIDLPLVVPTRTGVLGDCLIIEILAMTAIQRDALKVIWATSTPLPLRSPSGDVWVVLPVDELNIRMIPTGSGLLYTLTGTLQEVAP